MTPLTIYFLIYFEERQSNICCGPVIKDKWVNLMKKCLGHISSKKEREKINKGEQKNKNEYIRHQLTIGKSEVSKKEKLIF